MNANSPVAADRFHFLDHLRGFIIILVIALHASMTYMAYPSEWWYVIEPKNSILFTLFVLLVDVPLMQILFFIAGFFAYGSLEKYGPAGFVRQKAVRIGLPWLVGVVFLAPLVTYLIPLTRGTAGSYLEFWTGDFWGQYYQQSVYWFLGVLFLLFILLAALYKGEPAMRNMPRRPQEPDRRFFVTFWAITALCFFVSTLVVPADYWTNALKLIVYQPARLILYAGYFTLGIIADRRGWFRADGFRPDLEWWGPAALISAMAYLGVRWIWVDGGLLFLLAQAALFNAFCLAALMAGVALFQRHVDRPTRLRTSLGRNAYGIYYLHPLILYPAAYMALSVGASIFLEMALLTLFTLLVAWAGSAFVLTRLPVLRRIF